jgi:CrcB protein
LNATADPSYRKYVLDKYLVVLAGAGLGGLARYVASTWIMAKYGGRFPLGTFVINVSGSFLIGLLMTLLTERWQPHPNWRLFLVVGILGGYTTFSSFEYETYQAVRIGARWMGLLYVLGSVVLGYFGVWIGALAARR